MRYSVKFANFTTDMNTIRVNPAITYSYNSDNQYSFGETSTIFLSEVFGYGGDADLPREFNLIYSDIVNIEILDDEGICIYFLKEEPVTQDDNTIINRTYLEYVIKDSLIVSMKTTTASIDGYVSNNNNLEYPTTDIVTIEYGGANRAEVEEKYKEAKDYIASQN